MSSPEPEPPPRARVPGGPEPGVPHGLGQPPRPDLLGDGGVGQRGVEDSGHLAHERVADRLPAAGRQAPRIAGHRGDGAVALPGQRAQRVAVELLLGLGEAAGERDQPVELLGAVAGEQVGEPGGLRRAAQPGERPGQVAVPRLLGGRDPVVAGGHELVGRQPVQLVRDHVEIRRRVGRGAGIRLICALRHRSAA